MNETEIAPESGNLLGVTEPVDIPPPPRVEDMTFETVVGPICKDIDDADVCEKRVAAGFDCLTSPWMNRKCYKSCGFCAPET